MDILGLSAFYHESAACLLRDGRLTAAAAEERFTRRKHDPRLPVEAVRYCLGQAGLTVADLDAVAYYEEPRKKVARQLWSGVLGPGSRGLDPRLPERAIHERLGYEGRILTFPHHLSHAASAFLFSGFPEAAVLTADGVGEWTTTSYAHGRGGEIETFEEVVFPHSLGLLYSTITSYLGFAVNDGEPKVMGLAPYGEPRYVDDVCQLIGMGDDGQFLLNLRYFDFLNGPRMYSRDLVELLLSEPPRRPGEPLTDFHRDLARSLQLVLEEVLLEKAGYLHRKTGSKNLCLAGGVALNCVANGRLTREGPFERVFVQPAAGDAGACLGAAALAHRQLGGGAVEPLASVALGPSYGGEEIARLLHSTGLAAAAADYRRREDDLVDEVARRLTQHQVVGWFHGRMEHGPRALGHRSLLANPLDAGARERLNGEIKKRESFRPFAPSVLLAAAGEHFALDGPSPYMLFGCEVTSELPLAAVTHVDGSARPQTVDPEQEPRFAALLQAFASRTGCPVLLNTSMNGPGEPIACSPTDALSCFARTGFDVLVLEDFLIDRAALPPLWERLLPVWEEASGSFGRQKELYTFV